MKKELFSLGGTSCCLLGEKSAPALLLMPSSREDFSFVEKIYEETAARSESLPFSLLGFSVENPNRDLSPWEAPPVFGKEPFGAEAPKTLALLEKELLPALFPEKEPLLLLGGYSLAGLFALWAAYQTDRFSGIAAASPSVWFPNWDQYLLSHRVKAQRVYLSLGDREEKAKNPAFARVGERIRLQQRHFEETGETRSLLEWNEGNHFRDAEVRLAKGCAWLLREFFKA